MMRFKGWFLIFSVLLSLLPIDAGYQNNLNLDLNLISGNAELKASAIAGNGTRQDPFILNITQDTYIAYTDLYFKISNHTLLNINLSLKYVYHALIVNNTFNYTWKDIGEFKLKFETSQHILISNNSIISNRQDVAILQIYQGNDIELSHNYVEGTIIITSTDYCQIFDNIIYADYCIELRNSVSNINFELISGYGIKLFRSIDLWSINSITGNNLTINGGNVAIFEDIEGSMEFLPNPYHEILIIHAHDLNITIRDISFMTILFSYNILLNSSVISGDFDYPLTAERTPLLYISESLIRISNSTFIDPDGGILIKADNSNIDLSRSTFVNGEVKFENLNDNYLPLNITNSQNLIYFNNFTKVDVLLEDCKNSLFKFNMFFNSTFERYGYSGYFDYNYYHGFNTTDEDGDGIVDIFYSKNGIYDYHPRLKITDVFLFYDYYNFVENYNMYRNISIEAIQTQGDPVTYSIYKKINGSEVLILTKTSRSNIILEKMYIYRVEMISVGANRSVELDLGSIFNIYFQGDDDLISLPMEDGTYILDAADLRFTNADIINTTKPIKIINWQVDGRLNLDIINSRNVILSNLTYTNGYITIDNSSVEFFEGLLGKGYYSSYPYFNPTNSLNSISIRESSVSFSSNEIKYNKVKMINSTVDFYQNKFNISKVVPEGDTEIVFEENLMLMNNEELSYALYYNETLNIDDTTHEFIDIYDSIGSITYLNITELHLINSEFSIQYCNISRMELESSQVIAKYNILHEVSFELTNYIFDYNYWVDYNGTDSNSDGFFDNHPLDLHARLVIHDVYFTVAITQNIISLSYVNTLKRTAQFELYIMRDAWEYVGLLENNSLLESGTYKIRSISEFPREFEFQINYQANNDWVVVLLFPLIIILGIFISATGTVLSRRR
ncbi:MAG: hypothetical protein INQ03_08255 [Candidatus Heimdallarchaeota archaeon]|nr:hypothetical protein [Candidatus Heimdallarchaeota archaeon]